MGYTGYTDHSKKNLVSLKNNPPTQVGVPSILILCRAQKRGKFCKILNPKSAQKELLHNGPKSKMGSGFGILDSRVWILDFGVGPGNVPLGHSVTVELDHFRSCY